MKYVIACAMLVAAVGAWAFLRARRTRNANKNNIYPFW